MKARYLLALAVAAPALLAACASTDANKNAQQTQNEAENPFVREATSAAEHWLAEVDRGDLGGSWDHIASASQQMVPKEAWVESVRSVREPLGDVSARQLAGATYTQSIPGAPPGEYVVVQYATRFDKLPIDKVAIETVTPMLDKDGKWHVSGYYIKKVPLGRKQ
jgi:hypothetical protein